jgi:hypothetical protein
MMCQVRGGYQGHAVAAHPIYEHREEIGSRRTSLLAGGDLDLDFTVTPTAL